MKTKCEIYSRVVGYLRPVQQWNEGKVEEFKDRETFESAAGDDIKEASEVNNVDQKEEVRKKVSDGEFDDSKVDVDEQGKQDMSDDNQDIEEPSQVSQVAA